MMNFLRQERLSKPALTVKQSSSAEKKAITSPLLQPHLKLPGTIHGLLELALDLRFTWSHDADHLWKQLNPELWSLTHNPWLILQSISEARFDELSGDSVFCSRLQAIIEDEQESRQEPRWFRKTYPVSPINTVAYFSMEFGLSESLPIYSGGLGNVAGDQLKAADDLDVPLVGIGILYQYGYFRQALASDGSQVALYPSNNASEMPVLPVRNDKGGWFRFPMDIPGHGLWVRVWETRVGKVRLYLLDANDSANLPVDRCIELYADTEGQPFCLAMSQSRFLPGPTNGYLFTDIAPDNRPAEHYTIRIIPNHPSASVPLEAGHILWYK